MAIYNVYATESSKTIGKNDIMNVYGWAFSNTIQSGGTMNVLSEGTGAAGSATWNTLNNGGVMIVGYRARTDSTTINEGGLMIVSGYGTAGLAAVKNKGKLIVSGYGLASHASVSAGGSMVVSQSGTASWCVATGGGTMTILSYARATDCYAIANGDIIVSANATASDTTVYNNGRVDLSGGSSYDASVHSDGSIYVFAGGNAFHTMLHDNGKLIVCADGSASKTEIDSNGKMYVSNNALTRSDTVLSGGTMVVSKGGSAYYATVSSGGSMVIYGSARELTAKKGTIIIKTGATVNSITNKGADITLEKGAVVSNCKGDPIKMPDVDSGWNNYLYDKKQDPALNTGVTGPAGKKIAVATKAIQVDKDGTVSVDGYSNYVGYGDDTDFVKITLDYAAKVSFTLNSTDATKISIWSFTTGTDKKGNPTYSMKSLQATASKYDKTAEKYKATTKGLLLEKGTYYLAVQSTNAKKGGNAYYNVTLNKDDCTFYTKCDTFNDDWVDLVSDTYKGAAYLGTVDGSKEELIEEDWVGFGDAVDYRKFTLKTGAFLSLAAGASDAVKISICRVDSKTVKGGFTVPTLKTIQSTTLKKNKETGDYFSLTKSILLAKGDYYICVESTNAKKGGSADYWINIADPGYGSIFFDKGNNKDDWDDLKTKGAAGKVLTFGEIKANTTTILYDEWVGYGDEIDYRKFTTKSNAKLSFEIYAHDATKFTIYKLIEKTDKNGDKTYSLKALQTTKIAAYKYVTTKLLALDANTYYFSMESTNAKKGGNATYNISLYDFVSTSKSAKVADSLPEPKSVSVASAASPLAAADDLALESASGLLADSSGGLLASL